MLIQEFPDLQWLRRVAHSNFEDQRGVNNRPLPHKGWPNVVLNTTSGATERTGIKGPFSVFLNLKGKSLLRTDGRNLNLGTNTFGISNHGEYYDLIIPANAVTTTYNVHFSEQLFKGTLTTLQKGHQNQLDEPIINEEADFSLLNRVRIRDEIFNQKVNRLIGFYKAEILDDQSEEYVLNDLLAHLVIQNSTDLKGLGHITSVKISTRKELFRRLSLAVDYIHENHNKPLNLDNLSRVSALSKFHFIRTFRDAFKCTPQQYWRFVRLNKAKELLKNTRMPIAEIAHHTGFQEPNSFIRFFGKQCKISPSAYRDMI